MKTQTKNYLNNLIKRYPILAICEKQILDSFEILINAVEADGVIYTCGNGGSASDSEHIVGELMKSFLIKRPMNKDNLQALKEMFTGELGKEAEKLTENLEEGIRAFSLVSQMSLSSAIYNDMGVDYVFAQQIYSYARKGDVLITISTSGNSRNCLYAAMAAKSKGARVIGLTGESGGALNDICDVTLKVPSGITHEIQELHLPVYHTLCAMAESEMFL